MSHYTPRESGAQEVPEVVIERRERWWNRHVVDPGIKLDPLAQTLLTHHLEHACNVTGSNSWGKSRLARHYGCDPGSASRSENQLVKAGLIEVLRFRRPRESDGAWREVTVVGYAESWIDLDHDEDDGTIVVDETPKDEAPKLEWSAPVPFEGGRATLNSESGSDSSSGSGSGSNPISRSGHACMLAPDESNEETTEPDPYPDREEVHELLLEVGMREPWATHALRHRRPAQWVRRILQRCRTERWPMTQLSAALRDGYAIANDQADASPAEHVRRVRSQAKPTVDDVKRWWRTLEPGEQDYYREELLDRYDDGEHDGLCRMIREHKADAEVWQAVAELMPLGMGVAA